MLRKLLAKFFTEDCPNCLSAWTGGHPDPASLTFCVVCSEPKTGKIKGWVFRPVWVNRLFVTNPNFKLYKKGLR